MTKSISDTAFLVNESRARSVQLSGDVFAAHWVAEEKRDAVRQLWDDFSREVYPHDDLELGIRNRFFLTRLEDFVYRARDAAFVNVGAGFTSYPFLLSRPIDCIEIDYPHVIEQKRNRLVTLRQTGVLPERSVKLFAADLSQAAEREQLRQMLTSELAGRPSFILLEGLTYYLSEPVLRALLESFRNLQPGGSELAFDFWRTDITRRPVFCKLQDFFVRRFGFETQAYNLFGEDFICSLGGYGVVRITDATAEERTYAGTAILSDYDKILPENYAVLRRE
ncbi:MAG: class I SAM-dependent methyltransferase [Bryobacteraceae bacterium]